MTARAAIAGCLLLCVLAGPVQAWAPAGHKIAASIAYRIIAAERRQAIAEILRHHPRFAEDFQAKLPEHVPPEFVDEWIFQQAAIWPDMVRRYPPRLKDIYHHGTWHYCNRPLFLTNADRQAMQPFLTVNLRTEPPRDNEEFLRMNVLQAIEHTKSVSFNPAAEKSDRALAMSWLLHLAGDIHQPLHSVSMFDERLFPSLLEGDRGGNLVLTSQGERLHTLWDNFPGGDIQFRTARDRAIKFLNDDDLKSVAEKAAEIRSTRTWFDESHELAKDFGYTEEVLTFLKQLDPSLPPEDRPKLSLSQDYLRSGGLIARQRVVTAGYRLGALLK